MISNISREDVISVSQSINISLTEEEIEQVLSIYDYEEECDEGATWDLIIEHCIHQVVTTSSLKAMVTKKCTITNGKFSWILEVDKKRILFQGSENVAYFRDLYEKLGYEVKVGNI